MEIIETRHEEEMSRQAAGRLLEKIKKSKKIVLGLATGATPEGTYRYLIRDHQENGTSFRHVTTINLDEYIGIPPDDRNSYHFYMKEKLFNHVDIPENQRFLPDPLACDLQAECRRYDKIIEKLGGIDLQLLGIGRNGHIGFNEPGTPFTSRTHVVKIAPSTRQANARYFPTIDEVPRYAITVGIRTILESREILLLASGEEKAEAMNRLIHGGIDREFPASVLKNHPRVTVIADRAALSRVRVRKHFPNDA